jgi:hypothetical protein
MNNIRDKFEKQIAIMEANLIHDNDAYFEARPNVNTDGYKTIFNAGYKRAWQAATEQSQKEIAEKDAMIAEYDRLMSIDDTRIVLLQHNIVELKAREKVLVEALEHYEPVISAIDNSKGFVARQALANVRGE